MANRVQVTRALLEDHITKMKHSRTIKSAARKSGADYATFMARFRRHGISVKDVNKRLQAGESVDSILNSFFSVQEAPVAIRQEQVRRLSIADRLAEDITELVRSVVQRELRAA